MVKTSCVKPLFFVTTPLFEEQSLCHRVLLAQTKPEGLPKPEGKADCSYYNTCFCLHEITHALF